MEISNCSNSTVQCNLINVKYVNSWPNPFSYTVACTSVPNIKVVNLNFHAKFKLKVIAAITENIGWVLKLQNDKWVAGTMDVIAE